MLWFTSDIPSNIDLDITINSSHIHRHPLNTREQLSAEKSSDHVAFLNMHLYSVHMEIRHLTKKDHMISPPTIPRARVVPRIQGQI